MIVAVLPFVSWLMGSKIGQYLAGAFVIGLLVVTVLFRVYSAGKARERARQTEAALKALRERMKVDDEVEKLAPDKRLERLNRWVSDGDA